MCDGHLLFAKSTPTIELIILNGFCPLYQLRSMSLCICSICSALQVLTHVSLIPITCISIPEIHTLNGTKVIITFVLPGFCPIMRTRKVGISFRWPMRAVYTMHENAWIRHRIYCDYYDYERVNSLDPNPFYLKDIGENYPQFDPAVVQQLFLTIHPLNGYT